MSWQDIETTNVLNWIPLQYYALQQNFSYELRDLLTKSYYDTGNLFVRVLVVELYEVTGCDFLMLAQTDTADFFTPAILWNESQENLVLNYLRFQMDVCMTRIYIFKYG